MANGLEKFARFVQQLPATGKIVAGVAIAGFCLTGDRFFDGGGDNLLGLGGAGLAAVGISQRRKGQSGGGLFTKDGQEFKMVITAAKGAKDKFKL